MTLLNRLLSGIVPDERRYTTPNIAASCLIRHREDPACFTAWLGVCTAARLLLFILAIAKDHKLRLDRYSQWHQLGMAADRIKTDSLNRPLTDSEWQLHRAVTDALYALYQLLPAKLLTLAETEARCEMQAAFTGAAAECSPLPLRLAGIRLLRGDAVKDVLPLTGQPASAARPALLRWLRQVEAYCHIYRHPGVKTLAQAKGNSLLLQAALSLEQRLNKHERLAA